MSKKNKASKQKDPSVKPAENRKNVSTSAKKEAVLGTGKKNRTPVIAVAAGLLVIAAVSFFYLNHGPQTASVSQAQVTPAPQASQASQAAAVTPATQVTLPVSLFDDGKARHYEYQDANAYVRYFVIKSSDGVIRAAFDACDVCWRAGKGYFQEGDFMVCRNCGRRFESVKVNEVQGGCNPAPLNRSIRNNQVVIDIQDIVGGKNYFNLS